MLASSSTVSVLAVRGADSPNSDEDGESQIPGGRASSPGPPKSPKPEDREDARKAPDRPKPPEPPPSEPYVNE